MWEKELQRVSGASGSHCGGDTFSRLTHSQLWAWEGYRGPSSLGFIFCVLVKGWLRESAQVIYHLNPEDYSSSLEAKCE